VRGEKCLVAFMHTYAFSFHLCLFVDSGEIATLSLSDRRVRGDFERLELELLIIETRERLVREYTWWHCNIPRYEKVTETVVLAINWSASRSAVGSRIVGHGIDGLVLRFLCLPSPLFLLCSGLSENSSGSFYCSSCIRGICC
jgi:hypothetical protein